MCACVCVNFLMFLNTSSHLQIMEIASISQISICVYKTHTQTQIILVAINFLYKHIHSGLSSTHFAV